MNAHDPSISELVRRCARQAYIVHGEMTVTERADGTPDYTYDHEAFKRRLAEDPLGHPAGFESWPSEYRRKWFADNRDAMNAETDLLFSEAAAEPFFDESLREEIEREDREARDRTHLSLAAWLDKQIAPRDFLMGGVMCSTSRWFIFGETGIGKTLLGMALGAAVSAGAGFLKWTGQRKARVMYLDGELPMETFKERMQLIAARYGSELVFYGYNREDLGDDGLPPLNTEAGQKWLMREIEAVKPDLIIFDSIMCLLQGSVLDEAAWIPMRPFVRWLTANHIAQVWLHHANDSGKSFGDGVQRSPGFDGNPVCKVSTAAIRDELRRRGFLDVNDKGSIEGVSRTHFSRAKRTLLTRGKFAEDSEQIWRLSACHPRVTETDVLLRRVSRLNAPIRA
jgi:hypothetical protein